MKYKVKTFTEKEADFMTEFCTRFCPGLDVRLYPRGKNRYSLYIMQGNDRQYLTTDAVWVHELSVTM